MPEEKNTKFCPNCGAEIDKKAKICPKCGVEQPLVPEKVSNWWYVLAFFLGIVGGVIAWAVNKDRNPKKAIRFLIVGFILPIIFVVAQFAILPISLKELKKAGERAKDARIIAEMSQLRTVAEMIYSNEGSSYSGVSCIHPEIVSICQDIKIQSGEEPTIHSTERDYCAYIKLISEDRYYCIDNKGFARETSIYPGRTGYCDGRTFVCPK